MWSWLPVRITMYQPELLYTTEEHGCSMTTFFARVEKHEPTILIVKTTNGDVSFSFNRRPIQFVYNFTSGRCLEPTVPVRGVNDVPKILMAADRATLAPVKRSSLLCFRRRRNIRGSESTPHPHRMDRLASATQLNSSWHLTVTWSPSAEGKVLEHFWLAIFF